MPDPTTNGANPEDQAHSTTTKRGASPDAKAAAAVGSAADAGSADSGPRVSRARARTVPARPEPSPEAMPSADSAFASTKALAARDIGATAVASKPGAVDAAVAKPAVPAQSPGGSTDAEIVRGAVGRLDARTVAVTQGAVGAARAESLSLEMSAIGAAAAGEATISRSIARGVFAGEVHLEQAAAQTIFAERVTMESGSMALVVFARRVEGEVRPLLDWRGGLALGAALGVVFAILRPRRRRG